MKKRTRLIPAIACLMLTLLLFTGCGKKAAIDCPYTDLDWEATEEQLFETEGEAFSSYASTYGGLTYTYPKTYMEREGTIKYMFDENGVLMSVAWAYGAQDETTLLTLYEEIYNGIKETYGDSEYNPSNQTNYGGVWRLQEGHIILSVMITSDNKALQVAYVNPINNEKE